MSTTSFLPVFIDSNTLLWIILAVAIPVALILIIFLCILFSRRRYAKQVRIAKERYLVFHSQLTTDCKSMVNRLGSLGKFSSQYNNLYLERNKQYDDILTKRDKDMETSIASLETLLAKKNYRSVKEILSQTNIAMDEFEKSVSSFNEDLSNLLRDDSDTREGSLGVKEKYRRVKEFYENNKNELKPLEKSFQLIFENAEKTFAEYDALTDQAQFNKAKALLPRLDSVFAALVNIMEDLPVFESQVNVILPEKLNKLSETYKEMVQDGFTLDYLHVEKDIEDMRKELEAIAAQLKYLDVNDVKENLNAIQTRITDMLVCFENERKARNQFTQSQNIISTSTYQIEKEYSSLMSQLPAYQETFVLDSKYLDQMHALKNDIEVIGYLKRELDSYLDTNAKQPYTVIYKKISDMQMEIEKVKRTTKDYQTYLAYLRDTSQEVYDGLKTYYVKLKKSAYILKTKIGVSSYIDALDSSFNALFDRMSKIDHIIMTKPVDVSKAKDAFVPFSKDCDKLIAMVETKAKQCEEAEAAIVYANVYRMDYTDSRPLLDKAEKAFNEADFDRAKDEALKVIKLFSTDTSIKAM